MTIARIVISGCSGGGKSTLLAELSRRGIETHAEPGRRVVAEGISPAAAPEAFALRAAQLALADHAAARGPVAVFDRSLLDAAVWFERCRRPVPQFIAAALQTHRYHPTVYMTPPWRDLHRQDAGRPLPFAEAVAEYEALLDRLPAHGYRVAILPRLAVAARADWLIARLGDEGLR